MPDLCRCEPRSQVFLRQCSLRPATPKEPFGRAQSYRCEPEPSRKSGVVRHPLPKSHATLLSHCQSIRVLSAPLRERAEPLQVLKIDARVVDTTRADTTTPDFLHDVNSKPLTA